MKALCIFIFCIVYWYPGMSQTFREIAEEAGINHAYGIGSTGGGVSFHDFNGDGWDDITMSTTEGLSIHFYKNNKGEFQRAEPLISNLCETKQILWVDYDNDGDKDLYITCLGDINRLYRNDDMVLIDITESSGLSMDPSRSYGATWGDYDIDGWLDLYVTNKPDGEGSNENQLFRNMGNGTFENVTAVSGTGDPGKRPFMASFLDYNNDGYPDIYIAQDKNAGNTLLRNNGDGTFEDVSDISGADLYMEAMCVTIGDYDENGLFDIYVSNVPGEGNKLLHNNGDGTFSEKARSLGIEYDGYAWGTNFLDYDNDTDLDLYVSGMQVGSDNIPSILYTNTGEDNFDIIDMGFDSDTVASFSNAVGDFDNNGYPDIAVNNYDNYNSMLWQNPGGNNHWLKIDLVGMLSNRDGIGSLIRTYVNGEVLLRYTQSGVGFLGQNSHNEMIGLGEFSTADSITIDWPSRQRDVLFNIEVDQIIRIWEGSTELPPRIYGDRAITLCKGDSILLQTGYYSDYHWNNGKQKRSIYVKENGEYYVEVWNFDGVSAISDSVVVTIAESPEVEFETTTSDNNLNNGTIHAIVNGGVPPYSFLWSISGRDTSYIEGVGPGTHELIVKDRNGCSVTRQVTVDLVTALPLAGKDNTEIFPNPVDELLMIKTGLYPDSNITHMRLFSIHGKMVRSEASFVEQTEGLYRLNMNGLTPGIYIFQMKTASAIIKKKIVKN